MSTDTHPNKSTKLALDTIRANEIAIKNPETGKVTAVVTMLKVFGDKINNSQNANPKKLLNKPNKWLNSKKKALNRPKKHLKRLRRSIDDASKGLRVLLDKASSSDLLFIKKGSQKPKVHTQHEEGYARSCGTSGAPFKQKGGCN